MPHRPPNWFRQLDLFVERLVLSAPDGAKARPWKAAVIGLLLTAFVLRCWAGSAWMADLFIFPVVLAGFVLRRGGLWAVPAAVALHHLAASFRGGQSWRQLLLNDLVHLFEWSLLVLVILVTLEKYVALRRLQNRIDEDLKLARVLQSALILPNFDFGRMRMHGFIHQCDDVGGDFYYFRPFQKKYVVFCLGDVMGKGISASLLMSMVMSFMFEWGKKSPSPNFVLSKLNYRLTQLWSGDTGWFLTLFYAVYDEEEGTLSYAAAGGQGGLVLRADGSVEEAVADGLPLGVLEEAEFEEKVIKLDTGDRVVVFTDGVSEARSPEGELFGTDRLAEHLRRYSHLDIERLNQSCRQAVLDFTGGAYTDDLALLVVEVKPAVV